MTNRLVCILDHCSCDKVCPSCRGDYAIWREDGPVRNRRDKRKNKQLPMVREEK